MTQSAMPMLTGDAGQPEAIQTVRFGVDGNAYEIDLPARHASELRSMAGRYISAARRTGPVPSPARQQRQRPPRTRTQVRAAPVPFRSPGTAEPEPAPSAAAAGKPAGRSGTPREAQNERTERPPAAEADVRGGGHGLTDREKQELRTIADAAKPQRDMVASRLRTKGLAERDSAGNWWLTGAGRRELMSA
jgi:Lsr2